MLSSDPYLVTFVEPVSCSHTSHLRQLLEFEGLVVTVVPPAELHRLPHDDADLVVLNHQQLRNRTLAVARLANPNGERPLTLALVGAGDELRGIELVERGVDAFVATSCGSREFVARVRALLRRARRLAGPAMSAGIAGRSVHVSDLHIDPARRRVQVGSRDLRLTEQEFQLLYFLAGHPGRVFDRQALLEAVWGTHTFVTSRSVDALVKRVRQQLRAAERGAAFVETVRGVGYRLADFTQSAVSAA